MQLLCVRVLLQLTRDDDDYYIIIMMDRGTNCLAFVREKFYKGAQKRIYIGKESLRKFDKSEVLLVRVEGWT